MEAAALSAGERSDARQRIAEQMDQVRPNCPLHPLASYAPAGGRHLQPEPHHPLGVRYPAHPRDRSGTRGARARRLSLLPAQHAQVRCALVAICNGCVSDTLGRCLFLYGFCVYHVGRKRKAREDGRQVLVVDHSKITLGFHNGEWVPQFRSDDEPETPRVRMIMWRRPSLDFGIDSPAWAGRIPAERLEGLMQNIRHRDALNSKRALYTAFEQLQSTSSGQPWFSGAANQGYTGLYGFGATQASAHL